MTLRTFNLITARSCSKMRADQQLTFAAAKMEPRPIRRRSAGGRGHSVRQGPPRWSWRCPSGRERSRWRAAACCRQQRRDGRRRRLWTQPSGQAEGWGRACGEAAADQRRQASSQASTTRVLKLRQGVWKAGGAEAESDQHLKYVAAKVNLRYFRRCRAGGRSPSAHRDAPRRSWPSRSGRDRSR